MINPRDITDFRRTEVQLEEFVLFCAVVVGKNSSVQAKKLDAFLGSGVSEPFTTIRQLDELGLLEMHMREHGLGQYKRLVRCFRELVQLRGRLKTVTVQELESVFGLGSKSARFFILHSRPNQRLAVLDTHLLRYIRESGLVPTAPYATPSNKKLYALIEGKFLEYCDSIGETPAEVDLEIWKMGVDKARAKV